MYYHLLHTYHRAPNVRPFIQTPPRLIPLQPGAQTKVLVKALKKQGLLGSKVAKNEFKAAVPKLLELVSDVVDAGVKHMKLKAAYM